VSALHLQAVIAPGQEASRITLGVRRPERVDTLIAFTLLAALLAGWMLNFASVKELTLGLGGYLMHAAARQA
jgi:hypothetical protein